MKTPARLQRNAAPTISSRPSATSATLGTVDAGTDIEPWPQESRPPTGRLHRKPVPDCRRTDLPPAQTNAAATRPAWPLDTTPLGAYLRNVGQNDCKKICRAKTPSSRRKRFTLFLRTLAPLRLCGRHSVFPIFSSSQNFKYLWLGINKSGVAQWGSKSALGDDGDLQRHREIGGEPDRDLMISRDFDGRFQVDLAPIDVEAFGF